MYKNFQEIEDYLMSQGIKKCIALAGSHDDDALASVVNAKKQGLASAILIGDTEKTKELLLELKENPDEYHFIQEPDNKEAARIACDLVRQGQADIPMKGLMPTAHFLSPILDKENGFVKNNGLISQATVYEYKKENRLIIITDCAINISPDYVAKGKIIENAVALAKNLGITLPKVAVIAAVEVVNPSMQATIDAAMLSKSSQRGQMKGCIIDGPLALDNAISKEAAKHKGIVSEVAGSADILLMPSLEAGNIFTKSLVYFTDSPSSGNIAGTSIPVIMTSRSDTSINKYNSILIAIMQSLR